jgi:hypothetical protein
MVDVRSGEHREDGRLRMAANLFDLLSQDATRNRILDQAPPLPEQTRGWLGRLTLLYGVPFHYLVPDERMLPSESLRFFYVDPLWMEALLDGALSVGRPGDVRVLLNKAMAATYAQSLIDEAKTIRQRQQLGPDASLPPLAPSPVEGSFQFSGFLLRSEIVAGWRGVAVSAYPTADGRAGGALVTLRLERLASDILFGLFEGLIRSLEIVQPLEGLHFEPNDKFVDAGSRVLDIKAYLDSLTPAADNSADFAKSLLAKPLRYTFQIKD